ncbi:MAG: hypothetical protein ABI851_15450 [Saprospiraceae bacterium]
MNNKYCLLYFILLYISFFSAMGQTNKLRYFDQNNKEISKSKFNEILEKNIYLDAPGDTLNSLKLIYRENHGNLTNKSIFISKLEQNSNRIIDTLKPIVIIYYPGPDPCNQSGSADSRWISEWYGELESKLYKIDQIKPFYVYKDSAGLDKYRGILKWFKDPEGMVERIFFKNHYPCESFVVISKSGEYISYFGEFPKEFVWKILKTLK